MMKNAFAAMLLAPCLVALPAHAVPALWEWLPGHEPPVGQPKSVMAALPRSTVDRPDEVAGAQLHLMYVLPSDGVDEQADTDGRIGTSAVAFNLWLSQQTPGRSLRLDTSGGLPDITFYRLSRTDAQLRATGAFVRNELENELRAANMIRDDKLYAVYYGGSSTYSCGGGAYPPTLPGNVGAMYLKGEPPGAPGCATNPLGASIENPGYFEFAMIHELMHTIGLVAGCAPHHYRAGHASDFANDLMWGGDAPWQLPPQLDIGRDDYYGHSVAGCLDLDDSPYLTQPNRLFGISTRMQVLTGEDVMIGGFIVGGSTAKTVIVRARGPSLASAGVANALANPVLQLFAGQNVIATNDDWGTAANAAQIQASGYAPASPQESAILVGLSPGAYTAIVSGAANGTGVGIVEVYEIDLPEVPLMAISTRGQVQGGDGVMIGGFTIRGEAAKTVVVRARGPSLIPAGVANALANPVLQLVSGQTVIATNDDWGTAQNAAQIQASGFAPGHPQESAILITLPPGAYTAIVSGAAGGTGVGIVEVYTQ